MILNSGTPVEILGEYGIEPRSGAGLNAGSSERAHGNAEAAAEEVLERVGVVPATGEGD